MLISSGVSNMCLFAPAPYYKLNKGFFLGFLFKPRGGLRPPRGLNKKASEKYPLFTTCPTIRKIIHSLKLVDYLHVQADNPLYNYYVSLNPYTFTRLAYRRIAPLRDILMFNIKYLTMYTLR